MLPLKQSIVQINDASSQANPNNHKRHLYTDPSSNFADDLLLFLLSAFDPRFAPSVSEVVTGVLDPGVLEPGVLEPGVECGSADDAAFRVDAPRKPPCKKQMSTTMNRLLLTENILHPTVMAYRRS